MNFRTAGHFHPNAQTLNKVQHQTKSSTKTFVFLINCVAFLISESYHSNEFNPCKMPFDGCVYPFNKTINEERRIWNSEPWTAHTWYCNITSFQHNQNLCNWSSPSLTGDDFPYVAQDLLCMFRLLLFLSAIFIAIANGQNIFPFLSFLLFSFISSFLFHPISCIHLHSIYIYISTCFCRRMYRRPLSTGVWKWNRYSFVVSLASFIFSSEVFPFKQSHCVAI